MTGLQEGSKETVKIIGRDFCTGASDCFDSIGLPQRVSGQLKFVLKKVFTEFMNVLNVMIFALISHVHIHKKGLFPTDQSAV